MTSGFVLGPGEGSAYGFHGSAAVIKASGDDTLGQLGVIESVYPAALSVHEHVHAGEDEMFYLLGGEMEVFCGVDRWTVGAGSFVFVPRDRPHGFTVSTAGPAALTVKRCGWPRGTKAKLPAPILQRCSPQNTSISPASR